MKDQVTLNNAKQAAEYLVSRKGYKPTIYQIQDAFELKLVEKIQDSNSIRYQLTNTYYTV